MRASWILLILTEVSRTSSPRKRAQIYFAENLSRVCCSNSLLNQLMNSIFHIAVVAKANTFELRPTSPYLDCMDTDICMTSVTLPALLSKMKMFSQRNSINHHWPKLGSYLKEAVGSKTVISENAWKALKEESFMKFSSPACHALHLIKIRKLTG